MDIEQLEQLVAVIVTAGLVTGNFLLFTPWRNGEDPRQQGPDSSVQPNSTTQSWLDLNNVYSSTHAEASRLNRSEQTETQSSGAKSLFLEQGRFKTPHLSMGERQSRLRASRAT